MTLQIGQILDGKYRIVRELGSGAMGAVYEGVNIRIKRRVAIKVLLSALAQRSDTVKRFEREAQAAGRIGSEHIVEVLDLGTLPDGGFFMVMEFLDGMTLGEHIRLKGRLTPREIAPIAQQLLTGLEMAHEARVIHRDLKPENIFLVAEHAGQKNFVKILDFGVSKFNPLNVEDGMSMTRTGAVVGTPFYMAPEQAKGSRDIDHRSDLYSVGVILYEAITGQKPFNAGTFNELIFKIVLETPAPAEQFVPDLDPAFGRIIRRAIAREPDERYQQADEFRNALYIWLHTGSDGRDEKPLPPPPGDLPLDELNATVLIPPRPAAVAAAAGTAAAGAAPLQGASALRLATASPSETTSPRGVQLPDQQLWAAAGLPSRSNSKIVWAVVATAGVVVAAAAAFAVLYVPSSGDYGLPSPTPSSAAAATGDSDGARSRHHTEHAAEPKGQPGEDDDEPAADEVPSASDDATPTLSARPAPIALPPPPPPAAPPVRHPPPAQPPPAQPPPAQPPPAQPPPPKPTLLPKPKPRPKPDGRQIKDEL